MARCLLVTGGSRGIGAATALLAAERGYDVAIGYHADEAAAGRVLAAVKARGRRAIAIRADVAREPEVLALFETAGERLGRLDALVNSAGIAAAQQRLDELTLARIERMFAVNVTGSFLCAREAVRRMAPRHGGSGGAIVNVSSAAARLGSAGEFVDYAASKGAIDSMTIGLAKEVAAEGIRVNAVRPGLIETEIHTAIGDAGRVARRRQSIPMQRGGTAGEVARSILWLLSAEASYVTGALLDVTGGR